MIHHYEYCMRKDFILKFICFYYSTIFPFYSFSSAPARLPLGRSPSFLIYFPSRWMLCHHLSQQWATEQSAQTLWKSIWQMFTLIIHFVCGLVQANIKMSWRIWSAHSLTPTPFRSRGIWFFPFALFPFLRFDAIAQVRQLRRQRKCAHWIRRLKLLRRSGKRCQNIN